jgi:uncharacterized DUF497 family protein
MHVHIIWDLPDDPEGNYVHIVEGHDVTIDEVEEVLGDRSSQRTESRSSGRPMVFGWTSTGKYIAVVYEEVLDDPWTVYPITAYPAPPPGG